MRTRWPSGHTARSTGRGKRRREAVDSIRSRPEWCACWRRTRSARSRSTSDYARKASTAALRSSRTTYARSARHDGKPSETSFAPGECAQVDWGEFGSIGVGSTRRRLSFFVMVLCHSRLMYVEFTVSQTMEHFLAAHEHAFAAFGGCPARLTIDNLKSAVLSRAVGEAPVFNPLSGFRPPLGVRDLAVQRRQGK
ncbi:MAG: transposase [Sulfuritalea sp.]|nr:transposase [Sulfuritalea sp.]